MSSTVLTLRREWSDLRAPERGELVGDLKASFVAPLRRVAPAGLGLIGLPRWYGKRFRLEDDGLAGVNLLRTDEGLEETLPMAAAVEPSWTDGRPCVAVSYRDDARRPWRWVRDEVRIRPDGTFVGMTYVGLRGLRALGGTPFLLSRA
jgi:hypothetical protein